MIDLQPLLSGPTLTLRPLKATDFDMLHAAASDPLIWEQHPEPTRWQPEVFLKFFEGGLESKGAFVVTDRATGAVIGSSRYYEWDAPKREIAIGYTFLTRAYWGGLTNRELKKLMLDHAFQWADTVWLHIGVDNWRSRKATEKIGGTFSHYAERDHGGVKHAAAYYRIERPRA